MRGCGFWAARAPPNLLFGTEFNFSPLQVMATNLMTLEGKQTTVAVVGLAHVDGIEKILAANGWKPQRC